MLKDQVTVSSLRQGWDLPGSLVLLRVDTAWQAISQGGKARTQV